MPLLNVAYNRVDPEQETSDERDRDPICRENYLSRLPIKETKRNKLKTNSILHHSLHRRNHHHDRYCDAEEHEDDIPRLVYSYPKQKSRTVDDGNYDACIDQSSTPSCEQPRLTRIEQVGCSDEESDHEDIH